MTSKKQIKQIDNNKNEFSQVSYQQVPQSTITLQHHGTVQKPQFGKPSSGRPGGTLDASTGQLIMGLGQGIQIRNSVQQNQNLSKKNPSDEIQTSQKVQNEINLDQSIRNSNQASIYQSPLMIETYKKQITSLEIENETQRRQINELQQFVLLLSSALTSDQQNQQQPQQQNQQSGFLQTFLGKSEPQNNNKQHRDMIEQFASKISNLNFASNNNSSQNPNQGRSSSKNIGPSGTFGGRQSVKPNPKISLEEQISQALCRMDLLLKENFDLKREMVFERKKYLDLNQLYNDLRSNLLEGFNPLLPSIGSENVISRENISQSPDRRKPLESLNQVLEFQAQNSQEYDLNEEGRPNFTNLINNNGSSIVEAMNINQARIVSSAGPNNAGNRQTHSNTNLAVPGRKSKIGDRSQISDVQSNLGSQMSSVIGNAAQWNLQKARMQQTIITLSQEVEHLSERNARLLLDFKKKEPLYETYVKTVDELVKLRQAHAVLISLIKSNEISIKQSQGTSSAKIPGSYHPGKRAGRWEDDPEEGVALNDYRGGMGVKIQQQQNIKQNQQNQRNISLGTSLTRQIGIGEFITCGTLFKQDKQATPSNRKTISKDRKKKDEVFERQILNNEYLRILKDPRFSDLDVNFLEI